MKHEELEEALLNGKPIVHNDIRLGDIKYKCIHEIVKWKNDKGVIKTSAVLIDFTGRSFVRVEPERLRYAREV